MNKVRHPQVFSQSHSFGICDVSANQPTALRANQKKNSDTQTAHDGNRHLVIQGAAGVKHCDKVTARLQYTGNFLLCCDHVRDVVEYSVGEDEIETIVRERQQQNAPTLKPLIRKSSKAQPRRNAAYGFGRHVEARPYCPSPDNLFGISALSQTDLQNSLVLEFDLVQAP